MSPDDDNMSQSLKDSRLGTNVKIVASRGGAYHPDSRRQNRIWLLVEFTHPNQSLDGVGVALKVKGRQSNDDRTC